MHANRGGEGGGVKHHCEGGGDRSEVRVWTKKAMDDVELWPFFYSKKKNGGKPVVWTPGVEVTGLSIGDASGQSKEGFNRGIS